MTWRRKQLLSWPFIVLYLSAIGAVTLHLTAPGLGRAAWFPVAVGIVAALAIVAIKHLSIKAMTPATQGRWRRVLLFMFMPALTAVGIFFMDRHDIVLICCAAAMSLVFLAAAIATAFNLPPLRTTRVAGRCPKCFCKLDHWPGRQCPECRWYLAANAPAEELCS